LSASGPLTRISQPADRLYLPRTYVISRNGGTPPRITVPLLGGLHENAPRKIKIPWRPDAELTALAKIIRRRRKCNDAMPYPEPGFAFFFSRLGFLAAIFLVSVSAYLGRRILLAGAGADRVITRRVIASDDRVVYREKKNRDSPQKGLLMLSTGRYHVIDEHWRACSPQEFFYAPPPSWRS
jgi:hypothetical protein